MHDVNANTRNPEYNVNDVSSCKCGPLQLLNHSLHQSGLFMKAAITAMKSRKVECAPSDTHPPTTPNGMKVALTLRQVTHALKHPEEVSTFSQ